MAESIRVRRMTRERVILETENPDYFAYFKTDNLMEVDAFVIGTDDTPYEHKLIKLHFSIPENYPIDPPKVTFIQHAGKRIHPNLYCDGTVCLSILGTWPGDPWAYAMQCNSVLITVRSLLDNKPYEHEPGAEDNPEYTRFVRYASWRSLLLDYVRKETDEPAKKFLQDHLRKNGSKMLAALRQQQAADSGLPLYSPYMRYSTENKPDYPTLIKELTAAIEAVPKMPESDAKRPRESPEASTGSHGPSGDISGNPALRQEKRPKTDS